MGRSTVFLVVVFLSLVVIGVVGVMDILKRRDRKRLKKIEEGKRQEEEAWQAAKSVPEPIAEPEDGYVGYFGISKVAEDHLQFVQLKTQAVSLGDVIHDALRFYVDIVNKFESGDMLLLKKPAEEGYILLKFKPLERIHKKVES